MKKISIVLIILLLISLVIAIDASIDTFVSKDDPFNITFAEDNQTETQYIDIPKYAYVNNITIEIEGFQLP